VTPQGMRTWWRPALFVALLAGVVWFGWFLQAHDWEWGRERCGLLALFAVLVLVARPSPPALLRPPRVAAAIWLATLVALGIDARTGVESVVLAARTGQIRLDQGQNTLRAARLLLRGEDPYAQGQLLDLEAYFTRARERAQAGLEMPDPRLAPGLARRWWATLDPSARSALVLPAPAGNAAARRERSMYGYKYGPLLPLVTAPAQAMVGAAAVPALQLSCWAALLILLALCLRASGAGWGATGLAILCLSLEPSLARNALHYSASDVWALALMAAALLAFLRGRPVALGLCVAGAIACKLLPSLLLAPMLFARGGRRWAAPLACAAGLAALFGPFVLLDPQGFWTNLALWPSAMRPDNTHWSFYASPGAQRAARIAIGAAIVAGAAVLVASGHRAASAWFRYLAAASAGLVLSGVAFHNNYAPWFTVWALCLAAAGRSDAASAKAHAPAASG
jgi:hypothetical protein